MNDISIKNVFRALLSKIWLIILVTVLCGALAYTYCAVVATNYYRARSSIIVTNGGVTTDGEKLQYSDFTTSTSMLKTCTDLLDTSNAYVKLAENLGYKDLSADQLSKMISISSRAADSFLIDIRATAPDKARAVSIANAFAELAPEYINQTLPSMEVKVIQRAETSSKISPRTTIITISGAFMGAFLVALIVAILAIADRSVKGEEDLLEKYNVSILGSVPDFDVASK